MNTKIIYFLSALLLICTPLFAAAQITSAGSGDWTIGTTWTGGIAPTSGDDVIIQSGHTISVNDNDAVCKNVSFTADDALIDMNANSMLTVYGDFTLNSTSHIVFSAGWSATSAYIKFAGAADQTLSGWNPSGGSTSFRDVIIDKTGGTVVTDGSGMRLGIQNSLEIINGTLELAPGDDLEGRWASSGLFRGSNLPNVTIQSGGKFTMIDGGGVHHIRSDVGVAIGTITVHGEAQFRDGSTNNIILTAVDIEDGGKVIVSTGLGTGKFDCGSLTIKNGGELENYTTSDIWGSTAAVYLNDGGIYDTKTGTTIFPATFSNNGTVRYSRDGTSDQTIVDMDYHRLEVSFDSVNNKIWTLVGNRTITDELETNNSANLVITADAAQSLTVGSSLRMTSGVIDNSDTDVSFTMSDGATITRATGSITDAPVFAGTVDVRYVSSISAVTTGPEMPVATSALNDLSILSTQGVTLGADVTVNGDCVISGSDLTTGSYTVTLGSAGTLAEVDSMTVLGNATTTRTVSQSVNETFGGLGLEIDAAGGAPGVTTVLRVTGQALSVGGDDGIQRYFNVSPANNSGLDATVVFHFDQSELNGIPESELHLYLTADGGTMWYPHPGSLNETANTLTSSGLNVLPTLTLGSADNPVPAQLQAFTAISGEQSIEISWILSELDGNANFQVYRKLTSEDDFVILDVEIETNGELSYSFLDKACRPDVSYRYRVDLLEASGAKMLFETEGVTTKPAIRELALFQNTPNPFNPMTIIRYTLPERAHVTLAVFDAAGRRIANLVDQVQGQGPQEISWSGNDNSGNAVTSGVYFYRLTSGGTSITQKMVLLK